MTNNTESSNSSSSSKKKKIATSALAVALAAALLIGGTFSYLQDDSVAVVNEFDTNSNSVTLTETGIDENSETNDDGAYINDSFDIVPGDSEPKDPTVNVTYTLDSYVFLLVDDNTVYTIDGEEISYVDFEIDSAWTQLYEEDDSDNPYCGQYAVYYILLETSDDDGTTNYTKSFSALSGDTVSYSASLTNEDMEALSENSYSVSLGFQALIIQADPFTSVNMALAALAGTYNDGVSSGSGSYTSGTETTLDPVIVFTNIATAEDAEEESVSTTFTVTIPSSTTLTSSSTSITSLTLNVEELYSADSTDILGDSSYTVGDYTYDISLVDQDGNAVSASSGYIQVDIQLAAGLKNRQVYHEGTALSNSAPSDGTSAYFTYNSSTGVLSIYTQSFSEYEICWRGTSTTTISTSYKQGSYSSSSESSQASTATVSTTIANSASSSSDESYSSSTTFKASIPSGTVLTSSTGKITSLYPVVKETTSENTAIVPGGDAGDYTYNISLIDQDGNSVTATEGYISMSIVIKSGISSLTVTKKGDTDTVLSTTKPSDGSDYYKYTSSTGNLEIYTQSLGEYEISWNDTGLSLSALTTTDELTFTNSSNSKWTFTCVAGVKVNSQYSGNGSTYTKTISYGDWAIEVVMTCDTDISSVFYPIKFTAANSNNYNDMWYTNVAKSYTAGTEVGIIQTKNALGVFQVDEDYSTPICYDLKVGVSPKNVSITGASVTFELRIYENDGTGTEKSPSYSENYIVLDRITVTAN